MANLIEKFIIKKLIKKILKKLPKFKEDAFVLVENYGDDLIEKVFKAINQVVLDFAKKFEDK